MRHACHRGRQSRSPHLTTKAELAIGCGHKLRMRLLTVPVNDAKGLHPTGPSIGEVSSLRHVHPVAYVHGPPVDSIFSHSDSGDGQNGSVSVPVDDVGSVVPDSIKPIL